MRSSRATSVWVGSATYVFYALNGPFQLEAPDDAAYDLVIAVSTGALAFTESAHRLEGWCR